MSIRLRILALTIRALAILKIRGALQFADAADTQCLIYVCSDAR
jgi:hypothetical protein